MRAKILRHFNLLLASAGIISSLMVCSSICEAYMQDYPPYLFKEGAPAHRKAKMIPGQGQREYKSSDKQFIGKVQEESFETYDLFLKDGRVTIVDIKKKDLPVPNVVYRKEEFFDEPRLMVDMRNFLRYSLFTYVNKCLSKETWYAIK